MDAYVYGILFSPISLLMLFLTCIWNCTKPNAHPCEPSRILQNSHLPSRVLRLVPWVSNWGHGRISTEIVKFKTVFIHLFLVIVRHTQLVYDMTKSCVRLSVYLKPYPSWDLLKSYMLKNAKFITQGCTPNFSILGLTQIQLSKWEVQ